MWIPTSSDFMLEQIRINKETRQTGGRNDEKVTMVYSFIYLPEAKNALFPTIPS
jgi:hypothetical protein